MNLTRAVFCRMPQVGPRDLSGLPLGQHRPVVIALEMSAIALTRYIRRTYPPIQRDMLIGSVKRRGTAWGAIALIRPGRAFDREDRRLVARVAAALSAAVHRIDRDRLLGVRDRIDRKIMEQIHPKDLFYQILDGIRSLTLYAHRSVRAS